MCRYYNSICYKVIFIFFLISMQKIVDFVNSSIKYYYVDSSITQNVQGCLGEDMKVDG